MPTTFQPLTNILQSILGFNLSRIKCLVSLIEGLILVRTVNLTELASCMLGNAKIQSHYKRLCRFMKEIVFDWHATAQLLASISGILDIPEWTLILDRTNWMLGKTHINILYLSVACGGLSIPLFWSFLEDKKRGNSDHFDRIDLLESFIKVFGKKRIKVILGDREFIGRKWLDYLHKEGILYVLRLKEDGQYMTNSRGQMLKINHVLRTMKNGEVANLGIRKVGKTNPQRYNVSALRNKDGQLVVVIHSASIEYPLRIYRERWEIETMFKAFKSSGFNMEATHIIDPERLNTLFSVMAIAFCVAYKAGVITSGIEPIPIKSHGRRAQSILRTGLDMLKHLIANISSKYRQFKRLLKKILQESYVPILQI